MTDSPNTNAPAKLYRQVAQTIAQAIREGDYRVGERLPTERELVERFNVSRPTLREALIALELWGLVETRKGSGIYVISQGVQSLGIDEIGAFELTEARVVVEGEVAAIAATSASPEQITEMSAMVDVMADPGSSITNAEAADRRFHILLAEATGNAALIATVTSLWDMRDRSSLASVTVRRSRDAGSRPRVDDHQAVLEAVRAGDARRARAAMREHLTNVIDVMLTSTETVEVDEIRSRVAERRKRTALRLSA